MKCGVISPRLTVMHDSVGSKVVSGPCVTYNAAQREKIWGMHAAEIGGYL